MINLFLPRSRGVANDKEGCAFSIQPIVFVIVAKVPKMMSQRTLLLLKIALGLTAGVCCAQFLPRPTPRPPGSETGNFVRIEGGLVINEDDVHTAREVASHSTGTPEWTNAPGFQRDVFT